MRESIISTAHHYYLIFFHANKLNSVSDITRLFKDKTEVEEIVIRNRKFLHLQVLIDKRYGSENALIGNMVSTKKNVSYWYDMYMGKIEVDGKRIFFIAYPYFKIRNYIR